MGVFLNVTLAAAILAHQPFQAGTSIPKTKVALPYDRAYCLYRETAQGPARAPSDWQEPRSGYVQRDSGQRPMMSEVIRRNGKPTSMLVSDPSCSGSSRVTVLVYASSRTASTASASRNSQCPAIECPGVPAQCRRPEEYAIGKASYFYFKGETPNSPLIERIDLDLTGLRDSRLNPSLKVEGQGSRCPAPLPGTPPPGTPAR